MFYNASDYNYDIEKLFQEYRECVKTNKQISAVQMPQNELDRMQLMYTEINRKLYPFVVLTINEEYDYENSPIYRTNGFSREELGQMVDRVLLRAKSSTDTIEEIYMEDDIKTYEDWNRKEVLKSLVEALVLKYVFLVKRPAYFNMRSNYRFRNGVYDGINYYG